MDLGCGNGAVGDILGKADEEGRGTDGSVGTDDGGATEGDGC